MDAQHDLVWLKTNVSYLIIKYSVYEIYKYMYLWHTIIFVIIQETVYMFYFFYTNDFFYTNVISLHWYACTDITHDDVYMCSSVHTWINRIPMNYKAFGLFFSFFFISNRTFLHITLRYCLLNKCCCYFHFYLFLILNKNVFKRKCKRHTGQGQTDNARVIGLYIPM